MAPHGQSRLARGVDLRRLRKPLVLVCDGIYLDGRI